MTTRIVFTLFFTLVLIGCGGSGGSSSDNPPVAVDPVSLASYSGPGSKWDFELNDDGTFHIERRAMPGDPVDLTVDGDYVEQDNGFMLLTVTSAEGTDAPSAGETAWALEVPGFALFLRPTDAAGEFIAMVEAGNCPTENYVGNWVVVKNRVGADATEPDQDYLGAFAFDATAEGATLPGRYALAGNFNDLGPVDLEGGTCNDGIMLVDDAAMYLTQSGAAIVHTNLSDEDEAHIIFAVPQDTLAAINDLDDDYVGLVFDPLFNGDSVSPATAECSAGICNGEIFDSVDSSTPVGTYVLNLTGTLDFPEPGFITGEITSDGETGVIGCAVSDNLGSAGNRLITCVGQSPGDNTANFNLILSN